MDVSTLKSSTPKVLEPKKINNIAKFIQEQLESDEINDIGCVKVIPPKKIKFKAVTDNCLLPKVDKQTVHCLRTDNGVPCLFEMKFKKIGPTTMDKFKKIEKKPGSHSELDINTIENAVWSNLISRCTTNKGTNPVYATEWTEGRIEEDDAWNIKNFTESHSILNVNCKSDRIPGVQDSFALVGMFATWFCAHKEDNDLASINILLEGAEKIWYIIPYKYAAKFEKVFKELLGDLSDRLCDTVLRHKCFIVPPWILTKNGIEYTKHIQKPGEIMLTMYGAYHFGFNTGFNVCEAANLASPKFFDFFSNAALCKPGCWLFNRTNATKIKLASLLENYKALNSIPPKSKKKGTASVSTSGSTSSPGILLKSKKKGTASVSKSSQKAKDVYLLSGKDTSLLKPTFRENSKKAKKTYVCPQCHSSFGRNSNLTKHVKKYHDTMVTRYKCSGCTFISPEQYLVRNHQQKEHSDSESMTIDKVPVKNPKRKQQDWLINLLKPAKRAYIREKKTCDLCSKVLKGTSSLNRHMKSVHSVPDDTSPSSDDGEI